MANGPADRFPFLDAVDACVCVFDAAGDVLYRSWDHEGLALRARHRAQLLEHASRAARTLFDGEKTRRVDGGAADSGDVASRRTPVQVAGQLFRLVGSLVDGLDHGRNSVAVVTIHPDGADPKGSAEIPAALRDAGRRHGLTPREAEVAALVVRRRTNREIAERLGISVHTVRHHVERILSKLGLHSRLQVAAKLRSGGHER